MFCGYKHRIHVHIVPMEGLNYHHFFYPRDVRQLTDEMKNFVNLKALACRTAHSLFEIYLNAFL